MKTIYAIGDVHGDYDLLCDLLKRNQILNEELDWIADDSYLVLIGDLTDRGPQGIEVIDLVMKIEKQATQSGGEVISLQGNHDALILAHAFEQRGEFANQWCDAMFRQNGGNPRESLELSKNEEMFSWMQNRPLIHKIDKYLFQHADTARYYQSMGNTVESINEKGFELNKTGVGAWNIFAEMCDCRYWDEPYFTKHEELSDHIDGYMKNFEVEHVFHGHTRFEGNSPKVYYDSKLINLDGSMSIGYRNDKNRGFLLKLQV